MLGARCAIEDVVVYSCYVCKSLTQYSAAVIKTLQRSVYLEAFADRIA